MTIPIAGAEPIRGPAQPTVVDRTSTTEQVLGNAILGKDDFLRLLVTQLRNQDPLNPMEGTEFATQLAQFSSVEQLIELGHAAEAQLALTEEANRIGETSFGANLVGKDVLLDGTKVTVEEGYASRVTVDLPEGVEEVLVTILDEDGNPMAGTALGRTPAGRRTFTVDTSELPPGEYRYDVIAKDGEGSTLKVRPFTTARIDGMAFLEGEVVLRIGGLTIPAGDIIEIRAPAPPMPTSNPSDTTTGDSDS